MKLRGIDFGRVHLASGVGGFKCDGSEYWQHQVPSLRPDFTGAIKTVKTVTLHERTTQNGANMDLDDQLRPTETFPRCIAVNPVLCCAVNAVGLANKGLQAHLDMGIWQEWEDPFFLSLMATGATSSERMSEWAQMFKILSEYVPEFKAPFAVQENQSCPNAGLDPRELISDTEQVLSMGADHDLIQVPKFNVWQLSVVAVLGIGSHKHCDALLFSNTIPWGDLPLWVRLASFGTPFSPLRWRGVKQDGGYSGPFLLSQVEKRIRELRTLQFSKPIIACGGITKPDHVNHMRNAGADAVEFATVAMCRPHRVQSIIQRANSLTWRNS